MAKPLLHYVRTTILFVAGFLVFLICATYFITFHPDEVQQADVINADSAPLLESGDTLKIMCWNVQYMAGKEYVFWYDVADGNGPDSQPSLESIKQTLDEVARVISAESPDIVLLQEVNDGAVRTGYVDQLKELLKRLPESYGSHTSAFYWKAAYVPHPRINGSVGMKLSIVSKFRIEQATRYMLPQAPHDLISAQFQFKRAILEATLPLASGGHFVVLNTHLDAFAQGTRTMERQVEVVRGHLKRLESEHTKWVIGGDFNLLPPGSVQYENLAEPQQAYYQSDSELRLLTELFGSIPSVASATGSHSESWYTYNSNNPAIQGPDRTLDYIFYSTELIHLDGYVRQDDTKAISDHLPVVGKFKL